MPTSATSSHPPILRMTMPQLVLARVLLLCVLLLLARSACAQINHPTPSEPLDTFRPYARANYAYDSNFFRLENAEQARTLLGRSDTAETFYTLAAGLDMDWRISQQVLKGRFEINQTRFDTYQQLDYTGYSGLLQWNWLMGKYANGDLGVSETKTQASFTDLQRPTQNLRSTRKAYAHSGIKLALPWQLNLGYVRTETDNSALSQQNRNFDENHYSAGVQYQTEKNTLLQFNSQYREGQYPNRQIVGIAPIDNSYRQYDNGVAAVWSPSVETQLSGQLNYTQRRYGDVPQRNFSGFTGRLASDWKATEKTSFGLLLYRDIGVVENNTASYSNNRGFSIQADWHPTVKLSLQARAVRERQNYAGDPGFVLVSTPTRQDQVRSYQFETRYQVLRKTELSLQLQHGERDSNQALAGYRFNRAQISVRGSF